MATETRPATSSTKQPISVHILDVSKGLPAGGVKVSLEKLVQGEWKCITLSKTNSNGRCEDLIAAESPDFGLGRYKIRFEVGAYFQSTKTPSMYPYVEVVFDMKNSQETYHLPLLLSPFGYSTYRGS